MGLDQCLLAVRGHYGNSHSNEVEKVWTWRKHSDLQGYMEKLAIKKGIVKTASEFNCIDLELTKEDIEDIKNAITEEDLPRTTGFFFGQSYRDSSELEEDLIAFDGALNLQQIGFKIFYSCWW